MLAYHVWQLSTLSAGRAVTDVRKGEEIQVVVATLGGGGLRLLVRP